MCSFVQMRCDVVFRPITLFCKCFSTRVTYKFLDLEMHHAVMLAEGRRVAECAVTDVTLDVLSLASLGWRDGSGLHGLACFGGGGCGCGGCGGSCRTGAFVNERSGCEKMMQRRTGRGWWRSGCWGARCCRFV